MSPEEFAVTLRQELLRYYISDGSLDITISNVIEAIREKEEIKDWKLEVDSKDPTKINLTIIYR